MCRHYDIRPVERDCICLLRGPEGPHIAACESRYRAKFFASWRGIRSDFQAAAAGRQIVDALGGSAALN